MSDNIKVAIKVRPLIKREKDDNLTIQWVVQGNTIVSTDPEIKKRGDGGFRFDHIFDMDASNSNVFDTIVKPIVDAGVNGFNGTVFAYGQTSSGKTYTMMGTSQEPGIIPLAIEHMFDAIANTAGREFLLRVSYLEIYNEKVNDLLNKSGMDLKVYEDASGQVIVHCKEEITNCPENVLSIMKKGDKNRRTGETNMNERSSRSHTIFRITIESREAGGHSNAAIQVSQLNLVDLAGSERIRQTGATGERFNEGRHINMSLSALGLVILQLSESQDNQKHVNFRDTKLTRLLQASLGGNAMTAIICAVTPAALDETQCTLSFASRAKRVKNKPQLNEIMSDAALLKRYAKQLAKLNAELEKVKNENRSAVVEEMESKLLEKERVNQLLEERIELLKTRILSGDMTNHEESFRHKSRRRRTWCGPGTTKSHIPVFHLDTDLPTIKEMSPEKPQKHRKSIIQSVDFMNQTFQTAFADFELELIESERDREEREESSDSEDEPYITKRKNGHRVKFTDDVLVVNPKYNSFEVTPEKKNVSMQTSSEEASSSTPKVVLRKTIHDLTRNFTELTEFTTLEKQIYNEECCSKREEQQQKYLELEKQVEDLNSEKVHLKSCLTEAHAELEQYKLNALAEREKLVAQRENWNDIPEVKCQLKNLDVNEESNHKEIITKLCMRLKEMEEQHASNKTAYELMSEKVLNMEKQLENTISESNEFERIKIELKNDDHNSVIENIDLETYPKDLEYSIENSLVENRNEEGELAQTFELEQSTLNESNDDQLKLVICLQEEKAKLAADLKFKNQEVEGIKNDVQDLKQFIEKLHKTISTLSTENSDLSKKLSTEKDRSREAEENLQKVLKEKLNAESNLTILTEQLESIRCKSPVPYDNEIMCKHKDKLTELVTSNGKLVTESSELSVDLIDKGQGTDILEEECSSYKNNSESLSNHSNSVENDIEKLKTENNELRCEVIELKTKLTVLSDENAQLSKNVLETIEDTNNLRHEKSYNSTLHLSTIYNNSMKVDEDGFLNESLLEDNQEASVKKISSFQDNNKELNELQFGSCTQGTCSRDLHGSRRALKLEIKSLTQKLENSQRKIDKVCAHMETLNSKEDQELNISLNESGLTSAFLEGLNVSCTEEKVQYLSKELQTLKDDNEKLTFLYNEKCNELEKLQDGDSSKHSKHCNKNGAKIEEIQRKVDEVKNDIDGLKNNNSIFTSFYNKFKKEKSSLMKEISMLKSMNDELQQKLSDKEMFVNTANEKEQILKTELTNLSKENEEFLNREKVIKNEKSILEELESLKIEREKKDAVISGLHQTIDELNECLSTVRNELALMTIQKNELETLRNTETNKYKEELKSLRKQQETLENERKKSGEEKERAIRRANELEHNVKELKDDLTKERNFHDECRNKISELEQLLTERNSEKNVLEEKLQAVETKLLESENNVEVKYKDELDSLSNKFKEYTDEAVSEQRRLNEALNKCVEENKALMQELTKLQNIEEKCNKLRNENECESSEKKNLCSDNQKLKEELETVKECMIRELKSLKQKVDELDFLNMSLKDIFMTFLHALMSKEEEIVRAMRGQFERDKQKLVEEKQQSADAKKRAESWVSELEADNERLQSDLMKQERAQNEYIEKIAQLQHLLEESIHEKEAFKEKMESLETDFNSLQNEFDKQCKADVQQEEAILIAQKREKDVQEAFKKKEMELQSKLMCEKKMYEKRIEELTNMVDSYTTKNKELKDNIEGLEANEKQLKNIIEANLIEIKKNNQNMEKMNMEFKQLTEAYNELNMNLEEKNSKIEEISALLKNKCDMLSEYKTKLGTIMPDYEVLQEQVKERKECIMRHKEEIEALKMEREEQIELLKNQLNSEEIKNASLNKQLLELTNRNVALVDELNSLTEKYEHLQEENFKLERKIRNSTSKLKAETEIEDLKDNNKRLQSNLEGASNRISELQENKTQLMKELGTLKSEHEFLTKENAEIKQMLSIYKSKQISQNLSEDNYKYNTLLQEKNQISLELEDKKVLLNKKDKEIEKYINQVKELTDKNKELDDELEEYAAVIRERDSENAKLEDELNSYLTGNKAVIDLEEKVKILKEENEKLQSELRLYQAQTNVDVKQFEDIKLQNEKLNKEIKILRGNKPELRNNSNSSRPSSPTFDSSRRRHSRNEIFNQKRQLETIVFNPESTTNGEYCQSLRQEIRELELQLVAKDGKIATLEVQIESENFPYLSKCKDMEKRLLAFRKKNVELQEEVRKLEKCVNDVNTLECDVCKRRCINKKDESCQTIPVDTKRFCGVNSGIVNDYAKISKLEKEKDLMKELCRSRNQQIKQLENRIKELENVQNISVLKPIDASQDKSNQLYNCSTYSSKLVDFEKNSRPSMKENIPANVLGDSRSSSRRRNMWN